MPSFRHEGRRIAYQSYGPTDGEPTLVLVHGLLMNRLMYAALAPEIASRGNRVVTIDLLGHGESERPDDLREYSMGRFADQVKGLIDHLQLDRPVVGGTSLGANVGLELGARHPDSARALFIEMPVLDNALLAIGAIFVPVMFGLRFGRPFLAGVSRVTSRLPRSHYLVDIGLDWIRQRPEPSLAVLQGLMFGRIAPPREERSKIELPALVIGHPRDPLHPFSDSDCLVEEMPNARLLDANSILEWRLRPRRLNDELAAFVADSYAKPNRSRKVAKASKRAAV
jgi:pimeloyl-ACP methyl ester carboxylesterase